MRFLHFILAFVASVVVSACTTTDIDVYVDPTETPANGGDLQVVGRITQYTDCDVATRSKKEGDESKVTSMGLALFPIEDGVIGNCLYYDFKLGGSIVFIVDRKNEVFNNYVDKQFAMYIFANMQDAEGFPTKSADGVGKSLDYFRERAVTVSADVADIPANGFPMMGSLGNNVQGAIDADGGKLILKPSKTATNEDGLPLVNGDPSDNLEIPLKSMYAKFTFTISVKPDQEIVGNKAPRFDLVSYEVNNIPAKVDTNSATNDDNNVTDKSAVVSVGNYAQGATVATFDFYLPERYLSPSKALDNVLPTELKKGTYDKTVDKNENGYRDEDERYHQRYKNLLVEGKAATYVTINGKYTDHQGHPYDVAYNIYLGGNNVDDFNIIRNTHYDNSVTIRGISTSSDQAADKEAISIDWRVNVERSTPLVINLRRESLLDAHFEVRPLRLRLVGETIPTGTSATVQILNQDGTENNIPGWIRLEASGNTTAHITTDGVSKGKRMYFTTDLVTNTLKNNTKLTVSNLTAANQTVWIYVDENTTTTSRAAIVRVTYDGKAKDYKIVQNGLYSVVGAVSGKKYYIEQYEEYLYNYDAEDSYGQTKQEGMPWGLENKTISSEHRAFSASGELQDWLSSNIRPYYDFYIKKYDSEIKTGVMHEYEGQEFTSEIYTKSNGGVRRLTLAESANGAVEYCYNRNKRNSDGSIANVEWYLPSADELEDFIVPAYASFEEFQDNYYWTSQPAYIRNYFYYHGVLTGDTHGEIYVENKDYARATKVNYDQNLSEFNYALSGLNKSYEGIRDVTKTDPDHDDRINLGYYYQMPYYQNLRTGTYTTDQWFQIRTGGSTWNPTYTKYYVHLGHLYDLIQKDEDGEHGYRPRTESNRVRCVRKQ